MLFARWRWRAGWAILSPTMNHTTTQVQHRYCRRRHPTCGGTPSLYLWWSSRQVRITSLGQKQSIYVHDGEISARNHEKWRSCATWPLSLVSSSLSSLSRRRKVRLVDDVIGGWRIGGMRRRDNHKTNFSERGFLVWQRRALSWISQKVSLCSGPRKVTQCIRIIFVSTWGTWDFSFHELFLGWFQASLSSESVSIPDIACIFFLLLFYFFIYLFFIYLF